MLTQTEQNTIAEQSKLFVIHARTRPHPEPTPKPTAESSTNVRLQVPEAVQYHSHPVDTQPVTESFVAVLCTMSPPAGLAVRGPLQALAWVQDNGDKVTCTHFDPMTFSRIESRIHAIASNSSQQRDPLASERTARAVAASGEWALSLWRRTVSIHERHWERAIAQVALRGQQLVDEAPAQRRSIVAQRVQSAIELTHESEQLELVLRPVSAIVVQSTVETQTHTLQSAPSTQDTPQLTVNLQTEFAPLFDTVRWPSCVLCAKQQQGWALCTLCQAARCTACCKRCDGCQSELCIRCAPGARCPKCGLARLRQRTVIG